MNQDEKAWFSLSGRSVPDNKQIIKILWDSHLTLIKMATIKNPGNESVCKDIEKLEPLCTVGEIVKWFSFYERQCVVPQKTKNRSQHDPEITHTHTHTRVCIHNRILFSFKKGTCDTCSNKDEP